MYYIAKMRVAGKILPYEGTVDYIALKYQRHREAGQEATITHVREDGSNESMDAKAFEVRILTLLNSNAEGNAKSVTINKELLKRKKRTNYSVGSQLSNGEG